MIQLPWRKRPAGQGVDALAGLDMAAVLRERDRQVAHFAGKACPITRVIPVARAIRLGPSLRVVMELRLLDLASLQGWLDEQVPHPLDGFPPAWADPDPATRRGRLAAAWEAAASWPVRLGTEAGARLLGSPEGRAWFLLTVLRRSDTGVGLADVLDLLPDITPTQWDAMVRVAYATDPREEIAAELCPDPSPSVPTDWGKAFAMLMEHRSVDFESLQHMTLSQWRNLCAAGKSRESSPEYGAMTRRVRRVLESAHG